MSLKKLYIIGAGGFGREVGWLVERINAVSPTWSIEGFIDNDSLIWGDSEGEYPILGGDNFLLEKKEDIWVICAIGSTKIRKKIVQKLKSSTNIHFATIIDPSVILSERVAIGEGSIVCAGSILTVDISIGNHTIINLDCTIGHDAVIKDFVTINPSANVSGNVVIEEGAEIGTGVQIIQGKKIEKESILGAGAVVIDDIPEKCTAVGIPARRIEK